MKRTPANRLCRHRGTREHHKRVLCPYCQFKVSGLTAYMARCRNNAMRFDFLRAAYGAVVGIFPIGEEQM